MKSAGIWTSTASTEKVQWLRSMAFLLTHFMVKNVPIKFGLNKNIFQTFDFEVLCIIGHIFYHTMSHEKCRFDREKCRQPVEKCSSRLQPALFITPYTYTFLTVVLSCKNFPSKKWLQNLQLMCMFNMRPVGLFCFVS